MAMGPYEAMNAAAATGGMAGQNPNLVRTGSREAGSSYKQYAQQLGEEIDALQQQYGHLDTLPPDIAHHIIRKGREYENAINKWQEYEGRGMTESDYTDSAKNILKGRGASKQLFTPGAPNQPRDISGALEQAAAGQIPNRR